MSEEHFSVTLTLTIIVGLYFLAAAAISWFNMRGLERDGREGRAALAHSLAHLFDKSQKRFEERLQQKLQEMDAHIAMIFERVDRDRP